MSEKILIIAPSWIGDCVMAQPLLTLLKQRFPDAHMTVFAPKWTLAVMKRMKELDDFIENPFGHGVLNLRQRYQMGKQLRSYQFTRAFILPGSAKSALIPFFAKIPIRTGFVGESRYLLINDIHRLDKQQWVRMVDRFALLANPQNHTSEQTPNPVLYADSKNQQQAIAKLSLSAEKPILALCSGAEYGAAKRWSVRHFAQVARHYHQQGYQIWLFGSHKDAQDADLIVQQAGVGVNLCGKTAMDEAIDLLALAKMVVCNDSGLMHVAAALQRPLVAVYGSSSPIHTPPLSEKAKIISLNLSCSPCFKRECPLGHTNCLEQLKPEMVISAIDEMLQKH